MNELATFDWSNIYNNDDSNMQYTHFTIAVSKLIDKHFPLKTIRMNYNTIRNPWITPGIIRSIKRKNKLYRAKLKNPTPKNTKKFRHYRNKLNHLIRFTTKNYYKSKLDKAQGDMRATRRIINEILNKKSQPVHISNIVHNGKQFDKNIDIAKQLNKFFTNIGPTLAKKCGKTQRSYKDWMKNTCSSQLNLSQISPFKVPDELYGLNCAKAVGHDGLPISYLVKTADFIYQPLTHTSIASSIFPDEMKIAKVIPLFKSDDR